MHAKKAAIAAAAMVLAGCGGSSRSLATVTSTVQPVITKTVTVTVPPPATPLPKTTMDTDGTYRVGTDIELGTYRTGGRSADGESDCYWARLHSLNPTDIIDNNIGNGPQEVAIQPSDAAFLTHSCQRWEKTH
ncbi:hypothetical protein [Mycobacterium kyorinense]|uniref:Lipoprotein n=1 Tax=Mycobacterium kyorinense TaxID=487514 RepID=A0A1X1XMK3_9MYCO|nr:hypothetical protein [Mycobacterium kyorinense]ORW00020.1 hypothetical protein AWC14_11120 [Mycobacterium kyorinense]